MTAPAPYRALDAFRSAIPAHPAQQNQCSGLDLLQVCTWQTPWISGFDLLANDDLTIAVHRQGHCDVRAVSKSGVSPSNSEPGMITCMPPGHDWHFRVAGEVAFDTIHIPSECVRKIAQRNSMAQVEPEFRFAVHDPLIGAFVDAILEESRQRGPRSEEFIRSLTESLVLHTLRSSSSAAKAVVADRSQSAVDRARRLIDARLGDGLSLNELAEEAHLSRSHLLRRFRAETGISPHRYQNQQRVERAKALLETPGAALIEISNELGFCSQSHFTEVFRSHTGVTPRRYREIKFTEGQAPAPQAVAETAGVRTLTTGR